MSRLAFAVVFFALTVCHAALALDKVTFATNWRAQAEHGGFYQAVADGTYARYGLDVRFSRAARRPTRGCCWRQAELTSPWARISSRRSKRFGKKFRWSS